MIQVTSNAQDIARRFREARTNLKKANIKSHRGAAFEGMKFARKIAPVKTGFLKSHIKVERHGNSSVLRSYANKNGFPYHLWVNENIPTVTLAGRSRTYKSTRHTGVPGYFRETFLMLAKYFPKFTYNNVSKALRASFR